VAEYPALPIWTDAYLSDTRHLGAIEHGAYLLLLMEAWRRPNCDLPDDDLLLSRLAMLSTDEWARVKHIIMPFWKLDRRSKTWSQKRLKKERMYVADVSAKRKAAAAKRWNKTTNVDANADQMQSTHTHTHSSKEREAKASPKKCGNRILEGWVLPREWGLWAVEQGMDELSVRREADRFGDYWRSCPGQKGVKLDWQATWRNWIRKALETARPAARAPAAQIGDRKVTPAGQTIEYAGENQGWVKVWE
jgi:uncharacterized protein YdaU (DUF1376 family)